MRAGHDTQANPQGGLGASLRGADPLPARLHEPAKKEDRDRLTRPRFLLNEPGVGYRFKPDLD